MKTNRKLFQYRWPVIVSVIFIPPILFIVGTIIWAALTYNGICPGIMDIPAYPCTMGEFIGRNTISPFALAAQFGICISWIGFSGGSILIFSLIRWIIKNSE